MRRHRDPPHGSTRAKEAACLFHEMRIEDLEYTVMRLYGRIEGKRDFRSPRCCRTGSSFLVAQIRHWRRRPAADLDPEI